MTKHAHTLVIGGTGMLRAATRALVARSRAASVVARTPSSLARLRGPAVGVALDYRDEAALRTAVDDAAAARGPIDLAVFWIHAVAPGAPLAVAEAIAARSRECRIFHVLGSATADPGADLDAVRAPFDAIPGIRWRGVVLGFVREGGRSRWLTDAEISDGVLRAVDTDAGLTVVGTLHPRDRRP